LSSIRQTQSWLRDIFLILKKTKNHSLVIGYTYLFIFLVLPSLPLIQFLSPIVIILWPVAVVQIINFYRSPNNKKISIFKLDSQIKKSIPQLLRIGLITFFYALVISTFLSPQMQSIVEQANAGDSVLDAAVFLNLILKLFLFMLPLFAATWFSPMIVVYRGEGVFKALKSSIAAILIFIIPLLLTWVSMIVIFAVLIYVFQNFLLLFGLSQAAYIAISTIIIFSLTAVYIVALFIFQFLGYKQIFKL
jgi:magnesium-transporting ATPase (P-type)